MAPGPGMLPVSPGGNLEFRNPHRRSIGLGRARVPARAGAALAPATVGFLRVKGGKHFPTDVLTGLVVGAATGYLVPRLHKIKG